MDGTIIVSEPSDISAIRVIDWLFHYNCNVIKVNTDEKFELNFKIDNTKTSSNIDKFKIWYRRGYFSFFDLKNNFNKYLSEESKNVNFFIEKSNFQTFGSYFKEFSNNKIENLYFAKLSGLKIPKTILTYSKKEVVDYFGENKLLITKSIYKPYKDRKNGNWSFIESPTVFNSSDFIENFGLSQVQEYIKKKFEIRTFFFKDYHFSMAIFSQNNSNTKFDYRNYDEIFPNRLVPYELPKNIVGKLKKFMKLTNHDTGSIDIIYSTNNEYVFLEVNPQGQYDWLSGNCNYYIDKYIAESLLNKN
jgi:glutathione synthase/RimK-type ligase-like ATP-grasp enzyme